MTVARAAGSMSGIPASTRRRQAPHSAGCRPSSQAIPQAHGERLQCLERIRCGRHQGLSGEGAINIRLNQAE